MNGHPPKLKRWGVQQEGPYGYLKKIKRRLEVPIAVHAPRVATRTRRRAA